MKIRNPTLIKVAAFLVINLLRLLHKTCQARVVLHSPDANPFDTSSSVRNLYCMWHDEIIPIVFLKRHIHTAALVSQHRDGSFLTAALKSANIIPVRGSTSKGGVRAVRQLLDQAENHHITITPDGPRGPRHELKQGILYLSSKTQRPIVPAVVAADHEWRIPGSWTDQMIPKPFSTIYMVTGKPITVPANATREQLDEYQQLLQQEMDDIRLTVEQLADGHADDATLARLMPYSRLGIMTSPPPAAEPASQSRAA